MACIDQRRPVRPKAIDTAFLFTITGIVLGSIGTVLTTLVDRARIAGMVRDALSRSGEPYTESDVLAMIGPFRVAGALSAEGAALVLIWNLAGVAFGVAAVIYLFRPESSAYFAQRRESR